MYSTQNKCLILLQMAVHTVHYTCTEPYAELHGSTHGSSGGGQCLLAA
jgi:hypothetical protein